VKLPHAQVLSLVTGYRASFHFKSQAAKYDISSATTVFEEQNIISLASRMHDALGQSGRVALLALFLALNSQRVSP
jgi:uncharacterized membrane protein